MRTLFTNLRNIIISGLFFLLPMIVIFVILNKAWVALTSAGAEIASLFGMKSILGFGGVTVFTGVLLAGLLVLCGVLARYAFMVRFRQSLEEMLSKYLLGYDAYKLATEDKLQKKLRSLPYRSALIKQQEYWQPAYIVERGQDDYCVVFVPNISETGGGKILIKKSNHIRIIPTVNANDLDASLKRMGKGLLSTLRMFGTGDRETD